MKSTKYALITGATSGIGYELAKLFANDGYNLVITSRHQEELNQKAQEFRTYGVSVDAIECDLFKPENAVNLYNTVKSKGIEVDVLVNDAGQGEYGLFKDTDIQRELNIINLNVSSLVVLTKCFLQDMVRKQEGKILNLASIASIFPGPWQSVYHGTKAFVLSFTEALREEVKEEGITVTALLPGATDTDFFEKADMTESKIVQDPEKLSDPAEVAKDGYEALMSGKDKVVSGMKNKMQAFLSNMMSEEKMAQQMYKQQEPVSKS